MGSRFLVSDLAARLRGRLIAPSDSEYDDARRVYNGMIDRRPAAIARCVDVADVLAVVRFAEERDLLVSVRGGGHNAGGLGVCDDGLVIDLVATARHPRRPGSAHGARRTAAAPGATSTTPPTRSGWRCRTASSRRPASADSRSAAASGYLTRTLRAHHRQPAGRRRGAGGRPPRPRQRGRASRSLLGAARRRRQLRGRRPRSSSACIPVDTVRRRDPTLWPLDRGREIMRWYRDFILERARRAQRLLRVHDRAARAAVSRVAARAEGVRQSCGAGLDRRAAPTRSFAPVQALSPALYGVQPMPLPDAAGGASIRSIPPGLQWYWRADFVAELPDEAIERHLQLAATPADAAFDDAPVPDRRRRPPRRPARRPPSATATPTGRR